MKKKEYIFDKWKPNGFLILIFLISYTVIIFRQTGIFNTILTGLTPLLYGWAISFGSKK